MVNALVGRGICEWTSQYCYAREPFDYEHEHRPTRRTEHEHYGIRSTIGQNIYLVFSRRALFCFIFSSELLPSTNDDRILTNAPRNC